MASLDICENRVNGTICLVPFAKPRDGLGGSVACGSLICMARDEFDRIGGEVVARLLRDYSIRDPREPSELYDKMTREQQDAFVKDHRMMTVVLRESQNELAFFDSETGSEVLVSPVPHDSESIQHLVLRALSSVP